MPFVDVECKDHGKQERFVHDLVGFREAPCESCGEPARRVWALGGFSMDFRYGYDEGAGRYFDTARQRDNFLAEKGMTKRD